MPSFNSQRQSNRGISWSGIIGTLLVQILVLLALLVAVVCYLEWSSDANLAEFLSALPPSPSNSDVGMPTSEPAAAPVTQPPVAAAGPLPAKEGTSKRRR